MFCCKKCGASPYPQCIIFPVIHSVKFSKLISKEYIKTENFVCHADAQSYDESKELTFKDNCDNCNLCKDLCTFPDENNENAPKYDYFIKDLIRLNMLLTKKLPKYTVASNISVDGNFREKRIDIVAIHDSSVFILKTLSNENKYNYYARSYASILDNLKKKYSGHVFSSYYLVKEKDINNHQDLGHENCKTIKEIISLLMEKL